jgi:hypothetical protein
MEYFDKNRFWSKVNKTDSCWLWTGSVVSKKRPYGTFYFKKSRMATRISWELHTGTPIPANLYVCHHCDNPRCVRPDHLFLGTQKENIHDSMSKGRFVNYNTLKTKCKRGHELSGHNLLLRKNGKRNCRICINDKLRTYARERRRLGKP